MSPQNFVVFFFLDVPTLIHLFLFCEYNCSNSRKVRFFLTGFSSKGKAKANSQPAHLVPYM